MNNPFGVNKIRNGVAAGNKGYNSLQDAIDEWKNTGMGTSFGDRVRNSRDSQEFIDKLQCKNMDNCWKYNSVNKKYEKDFMDINIKKWMKACECVISSLKN